MTIVANDTISLKIKHHINKILDGLAQKEDRSKSSLIRKIIDEYIEDQEDIKIAENAMLEFEKNPKVFSLDYIKEENGL